MNKYELCTWIADWRTGNSLPVYRGLYNRGYFVCAGPFNLHDDVPKDVLAGPFRTLEEVYQWRESIRRINYD